MAKTKLIDSNPTKSFIKQKEVKENAKASQQKSDSRKK